MFVEVSFFLFREALSRPCVLFSFWLVRTFVFHLHCVSSLHALSFYLPFKMSMFCRGGASRGPGSDGVYVVFLRRVAFFLPFFRALASYDCT